MTSEPLREPTFLILTALADGPKHGYGILLDVAKVSGEQVRLRAGTLYAALDRLSAEGLIEADREEVVEARLRRYYRISKTGAARLAEAVERQRRNLEIADHRLRLMKHSGVMA